VELKRVLPGTEKGSTWNSKGFYVELKRVLPGTQKGSKGYFYTCLLRVYLMLVEEGH
jgi:hypothetical protein